MNYIITGATSFIGSAIVDLLASKGNNVIAICRESSKNIHNIIFKDNISFVYLDYKDLSDLISFVDKADVFLNFAWVGSVAPEDRSNAGIQNQNIDYSIKAMNIAKQLGCKLFVDSGSQAEYGIQDSLTSEESECNPITEYGKAKLETYKQLKDHSSELKIGYIHLRIFSVYGENDHDRTLVSSCIRKMLKNESIQLSDCTQKWNFLYKEDAAKLIASLVERLYDKSPCDAYNIASLDTRLLKSFVIDIQKETDSLSDLLFGAIDSNQVVSLNPSIEKILSIVENIEFTPFVKGIRKIVDYMKDKSKVIISVGGGRYPFNYQLFAALC